ncbi:preprotein translocase subunit SecG [Clostridium sp. DJ247]|uniref:preprotein translocase subunit SecG n=1 Tax=Clostridium sp. DJ247 TaxID=2726188 RepID=UPI00162755A4|nr:preprotein translocase subunit SecG [Clostridium sp. DJ247]MBC2582054.1 preprotein translocase subunit SecG [Clostridium sp. DJ247]
MRTLLTVIQLLVAIVLIVAIMMQPSKTNGLSGLISGGTNESFYSRNKSRTSEAMLSRVTVISAIIFAALCVAQNLVK